MPTYDQLRDASYRGMGLDPAWSTQSASCVANGIPVASDGVDVTGALVAQIRVQVRNNPQSYRGHVVVETVSDSTTYTVTINGTPYNYLTGVGETEDDILEGLRAAISAGVVPVTPSVSGSTLYLDSDSEAAFTLNVSADLGGITEATSVDFRLWARSKGKGMFDLVNGGDFSDIEQNWTERIECSGYVELYLEATATDGLVTLEVGPCQEAS